MNNDNRFVISVLVLFALIMGAVPAWAQDTNLLDDCVTAYDSTQDYFPNKVAPTLAENFTVEYFNHYKVVTVTDAFENAEPFTYVLVQCGTPAPSAEDFPADAQFLEVPVESMIAMSTTQIPHLQQLDQLDKLVGLDSFLYVSNAEVVGMVERGELVEVGFGGEVNVELVLETAPDVVMTYGFNPDTDAHPVLIESGIFTALNAEWRESTPLGRAEWIKYTSLFFNAEAQAQTAYDSIATAYGEARALAQQVAVVDRPIVLWNSFSTWTEGWLIPGAQTYVGALIQDAGGIIALGETAPEDSTLLSFEAVYADALEADLWVINEFGMLTLEDLLAQDARFADFAAVTNGAVWNDNLDVNANGGNNYYELGVTNPHLVLQDLVAMFHPQLLPNHEFRFYRQFEPLQ